MLYRKIIATGLTLLLIFTTAPSHAATNAADSFIIGSIGNKPKIQIQYCQALANYIAQKLSGSQSAKGTVRVASSHQQLAEWLKNGEIDIASETIFAALQLQEESGAEFLMRRWKKGVQQYNTVFFTHIDSDIKSLSDLSGKFVVLEDQSSTSGYFIPVSTMIEAGLDLVVMNSKNDPVPEGKVGVIFSQEQLNSRTEINMTYLVYKKSVAAGAYSNLNWMDPTEAPAPMKNRLRIFHESAKFPRSIILVNPSTSDSKKKKLKAVLLDAHNTEQGREALKAYQDTTRFDDLQQSTLESIESSRQLLKIVQGYF